MSPEETAAQSPLDKPLYQLTEDDISQLTREDCRRYLKEKGMRRPSWNKSQAIQQVISLKTLLEPPPPPDSDAGARRSRYIPHPENPLLVANKGTSADTEASVSAEESVPDRRKDSNTPVLSGDLSYLLVAPDIDSVSPRTTGVTDVPVTSVGQMTIFYSGKVNVYDDMPADKARAIMQLAASPLHQEAPNYGITTGQPLPCHLRATSVKVGPESAVLLQTLQAGDIGNKMTDNSRLQREERIMYHGENHAAEGPASRKASVQRYLEKRKDRFKSKRKIGVPSCANLDIYLNHQIGTQTPNEHSCRSGTCSPPPIKPPKTPTRCSSVEKN